MVATCILRYYKLKAKPYGDFCIIIDSAANEEQNGNDVCSLMLCKKMRAYFASFQAEITKYAEEHDVTPFSYVHTYVYVS